MMIVLLMIMVGCAVGVRRSGLQEEVGTHEEEGKQVAEDSNYHASSMEDEWSSSPHAGKICDTAKLQVPEAKIWLRYSEAVFTPKSEPARPPTHEEEQVLSYFLDRQTGQKRFIEPLVGVARHPLALHAVHCLEGDDDMASGEGHGLFDIRFLITENYCDRQSPKPQVKLFDLGCTVYANPGQKADLDEYSSGSGTGPSIPLFYSMFKDRCLEPDDIFAWEAKTMPPQDWWNGVPVGIRSKLRFYNTPVEELSLEESIQGVSGSDASFLRMLPLTVKPEDYVVLKVDIDGGPEMEIVEAIAAQPKLSALVDELFFENHFRFDDKEFGWGENVVPGNNVDSAIALMTRLRRAGVRAHFWI